MRPIFVPIAIVCLLAWLPPVHGERSTTEFRSEPPQLEFLSAFDLPAGSRHGGEHCIGGLSAIDYDRERDRYFVISDARSEPRFFVFDIDISGDPPQIVSVTPERTVVLTTREHVAYPRDRIDPEGLALTSASQMWISSEGNAELDVPAFVDLVDPTSGLWLSSLTLPEELRPTGSGPDRSGIRPNLGLESLTLSLDRKFLITATESSLAQDAPGKTTYARLYRYRLEPNPVLVDTFLYPIKAPAGMIVAHGLVELRTSAQGPHGSLRVFALERTFGTDIGLINRLFTINLPSIGDPSPPEARVQPVVDKDLLLDFEQRGIALENYEGIAFGPDLPDGRQSMILVGDNDNPGCRFPLVRPNRFLLFAFGDLTDDSNAP